MPRRLTLLNVLAAVAMAVVALWGSGKAGLDRIASPSAVPDGRAAVLRPVGVASVFEVAPVAELRETYAKGSGGGMLFPDGDTGVRFGYSAPRLASAHQIPPFVILTGLSARAPPSASGDG